jgi:hypothetical protein
VATRSGRGVLHFQREGVDQRRGEKEVADRRVGRAQGQDLPVRRGDVEGMPGTSARHGPIRHQLGRADAIDHGDRQAADHDHRDALDGRRRPRCNGKRLIRHAGLARSFIGDTAFAANCGVSESAIQGDGESRSERRPPLDRSEPKHS